MEHQRRIGRYQVLEELAAGGQATVFRAWDTTTGQVVALKVMHPHLVGDAAYLERFRREAGLAASISHPNVIRLFEVGQDGDSHYISMEYLALSVHDLIEAQGQLPIDRVADICRQTALALEAADKRGIVHRDIKPQNIMMAPDGTAKVSDFGIARASQLSTMTRTGALMGTPQYMAPEQAQGQRASVRSDIYSLGIVMYQMLTGKVPFEAETPWAVIRQHVETQPKDVRKLRSDVPKALGSLVTRCLEKDPDRRFQTPRELALAIEKAVPQISRPQPQQQPISSVRQSPPKIAPIPAPSQEPRVEPSGAAPNKGGFIMRTARRVIAAGVLIAFVVGVAASALPGGFLPGSPDDHESGPTTVAGQEEPGPVVSERPVVSQGPWRSGGGEAGGRARDRAARARPNPEPVVPASSHGWRVRFHRPGQRLLLEGLGRAAPRLE
jgi:serine/threonine-protein kinase